MSATHFSGPLALTSTQLLIGPGAVNTVSSTTLITTTGADAFTLANGTDGLIKTIVLEVAGGAATLTPDNLAGGTTLTFAAVGDSVVLLFAGGSWYVTGGQGAVLA